MLASIRQLRYPREFRIDEPCWPGDLVACVEEIIRFLQSSEEKEFFNFLKEVGNGLWRVRNRLSAAENGSRDMRSAMRFLESMWDSISQSGVDIRDHTGEIITGGEALEVLAFEECLCVPYDQVIETVKPTISYRGKVVQIGEVIVGRPPREVEITEQVEEASLADQSPALRKGEGVEKPFKVQTGREVQWPEKK